MSKIGLFFGSFNPIHIGHLALARLIQNEADLKEIWFIVSPQNPFKKESDLAHEFDRIDMVRASIEFDISFKALDIEFKMPRPSYTIDTLIQLIAKYRSNEYHIIIGQDNLIGFHKWKNHEEILKTAKLLVYPRPVNSTILSAIKFPYHLVKMPFIDISSSLVRSLVKEKKSIKFLVPEQVEEIILSRNLYN